eukprot:comp21530_c0_seq1/m.29953 comp21530_c0_seq1/g.29953  ORF comp21530_c0_seq1/g.29953 comp21530_c0_seq1/m.29953 type:complete len:287 (-) comp21530_c0_seq1:525-1385(-)
MSRKKEKEDITEEEKVLRNKYKKLSKLKDLAEAAKREDGSRKRPAEDDDHVEAAKKLLEAERKKASVVGSKEMSFLQKANANKKPRTMSQTGGNPGEASNRTEEGTEERTQSHYQPQQQFVPAGYDGGHHRPSQQWGGQGGGRQPISDEVYQRTCFVGGLRPPVNEDVLHGHFQAIGPIHEIRLIPNKGIAFITFGDPSCVDSAIRTLNNEPLTLLNGQPCHIRVSHAKRPNSQHHQPRQPSSTWTDQDSNPPENNQPPPHRGSEDKLQLERRESRDREMVTYSDL